MIGYQWGWWEQPGGSWVYPRSRVNLFPLPFDAYSEGTCANYRALDQKLLDDEELRENVLTNLYDDLAIPKSDRLKIEVAVKNGIAYLGGEVRHRQTKVQAYTDALQTQGITDVKNQIKLFSQEERR